MRHLDLDDGWPPPSWSTTEYEDPFCACLNDEKNLQIHTCYAFRLYFMIDVNHILSSLLTTQWDATREKSPKGFDTSMVKITTTTIRAIALYISPERSCHPRTLSTQKRTSVWVKKIIYAYLLKNIKKYFKKRTLQTRITTRFKDKIINIAPREATT